MRQIGKACGHFFICGIRVRSGSAIRGLVRHRMAAQRGGPALSHGRTSVFSALPSTTSPESSDEKYRQ